MKKVLIVATVSGFLSQFEINNVVLLKKLGFEVHYASNFNNPHYGKNNERLCGREIICHQIDFARSPFSLGAVLRAYCQLKNLFQKEQFTLVHCHTPVGGMLARLAARKQRSSCINEGKCRVIYTAHGFHFYKGAPLKNWLFYYPVEWLLSFYTDALITITQEDYQRACRFKGIKKEQVFYVPGVGVRIEEAVWNREEAKKQLGWDKDTILFVSVGELNKNKNHRMAVEALKESGRKKFGYFICGEGKEHKALARFIRIHHLEKNIRLLGYCEDIHTILAAADVFLMPSYREGLSVALQEAMVAGLPAVCCNIRGNRELIVSEKGGFLFPAGDKKELKKILDKIFSYYDCGQIKLWEMGEYNRKKIINFKLPVVEAKMDKIYREVSQECTNE